jgi:hypothetical protein
MEDYEIAEVTKILNEWNPLGDDAAKILDQEGYRTESIDMLFYIKLSKGKAGVEKVIMDILNEAFILELTRKECSDVASRIFHFLSKKH